MYKKLVRYDRWRFAEVDPIRLHRCASVLKHQIESKISSYGDQYFFYSLTIPVIELAIHGEINQSMDFNVDSVISGNYCHDESEGLLPPEYDREFTKAVADFSVTLQGYSLEQAEKIIKDGVTYGFVDFEEEGDWPDKVKFP